MDPPHITDNMADKEEDYPEEILYFKNKEDIFIKSYDTVEKVLSEINGNHHVEKDGVEERIQWAILMETDADQETAAELSNSILTILVNFGAEAKEALDELGVGEEVLEKVIDLAANHRGFIIEVVLKEKQGRNYWRRLETEETIRDGEFGFTHHIQIGTDEEISLTTSSDSLLQLVQHLLRRQNDMIEREGEEVVQQMRMATLQAFSDSVMDLLTSISEHREDIGFITESRVVEKEENVEDLGPFLDDEEGSEDE